MRELLRADGLCKSFRLSPKQQRLEHTHDKLRRAVNDLSFSANEGEIFGLLGPNGAGKTTTLRLLATLIRPDRGDARIDGYSVVSQPDKVRERIGFLTSELKLEDFFTPNYLFDFFSDLHRVPPDLRAARKQALFATFGIDKFAEVKVAELSTGMKQKASLAISLVHDPAIIIFDEPTNGLDVLTARTVTDFLLRLRSQGKTVIVSTHIFSLIERVCDRVGVIIDGSMAVCGTLDEVRGGMSLEDRFFDLYAERMGQDT
jgi:sodium transport system ATP-binding protein